MTECIAFPEKARNLRPFYFIAVVWGERYIHYLLNHCIASLLSPGNIPALLNRGKNKFLIATTEADWASMLDRPIFRMLKEYIEPVLVPIPPCPQGESACVHMGIGHKLATHIAFEDNAYSVLLTPDLMLSDGTMANVQRRAVEGYHVVLVAALRFGEEPLFQHLQQLGLARLEIPRQEEGSPICVTGRQFVRAGIRSFHSETLRYEWEASYLSAFPVACWWRAKGGDGIIVHSLSWAPLLVDYAAVEHHDVSMMDNWTIDGDYVYRNFGLSDNVYVVRDSDEMMLVSWAPLADREQSLAPNKRYESLFWGTIAKFMVLYGTYSSPVFDPLKRKLFFLSVFWHSDELNDAWDSQAHTIVRKLRLYLNAEGQEDIRGTRTLYMRSILAAQRLRHFSFRCALYLPILFWRICLTGKRYWGDRHHVLGIASRALKGDRAAILRVKRSMRLAVQQIFGI